MSATADPMSEANLRNILAQIDRVREETLKFTAEQHKLLGEQQKLLAEAQKPNSETTNPWVVRYVTPIALVVTAVAGLIAATPILLRLGGG